MFLTYNLEKWWDSDWGHVNVKNILLDVCYTESEMDHILIPDLSQSGIPIIHVNPCVCD